MTERDRFDDMSARELRAWARVASEALHAAKNLCDAAEDAYYTMNENSLQLESRGQLMADINTFDGLRKQVLE
jgi:hypothetical protein